MTDQDERDLAAARQRTALAQEQREIGRSQLETLNRIAELNSRGLEGLNRLNVAPTSTADLLNSLHEQSAATPQLEAAPPEPRQIDLTARRQELFDAHATALHQLHYLEGALNEIDYLLELTNPQPANTAEGEK